jgi:allantoin racemase
MKLLIINPNISESVTTLIEAEARRAASKDTEITMMTAPLGLAYIETQAEALIGGYAVLNILAERHSEFDAAIIAAFGDPGIAAAQEVLDIPVVGLSNSAFVTACLAGPRFSIVAISERIVPWYRSCVVANGLIYRLASIRSLTELLKNVGTIQEEHRDSLLELCTSAARKDGADSIVVAGAPLAGLAAKLKFEISVPLIDGVSSAVSQAELMVSRGVHKLPGSRKAVLPAKAHAGMSSALTAMMTSLAS